MRVVVMLALAVVCGVSHAEPVPENAPPSIEKMLVVSKMAGLCESVLLLFEFQKKNQIDGGEQFFDGAVKHIAEAKQLDPKELISACKGIGESYSQFLEVARNYEAKK